MSGAPLRIGVIGAGRVAQFCHIACLSEVPGCHVVAVSDSRAELACAVADHFNIPAWFSDHRRLLDAGGLDAVVVATHRMATGPAVRDVLLAGLPVLSEKPMAMTLQQATELVDLGARAGVLYGVGFMKRHDPGVSLFRKRQAQITASGEAGALRFVRHACFARDYGLPVPLPVAIRGRTDRTRELWPRRPTWLPEPLEVAYDSFINRTLHGLNLVRLLVNRQLTPRLLSAGDVGWSLAVCDADNVPVVFESGQTPVATWDEELSLHFDYGRLILRLPSPMDGRTAGVVWEGEAIEGRGPREVMEGGVGWAFARQAEAFVSSLRTGMPFAATGADSLADMVLAEGLWRSAAVTPPQTTKTGY